MAPPSGFARDGVSAPEPRALDALARFTRFLVVGANSGGDQVADWLTRHGHGVIAFADLDPARCGSWRGLPLLPLHEAVARLGPEGAAVIGTYRQGEAAAALRSAGVPSARIFPFVNDMFAAHFAPGVFARNESHYGRARARLADAASRALFDAVMAYYCDLDPSALIANPRQIGQYGYDAPGAMPRPGDTIVDCGAFTGDMLGWFLEATGGDCRIVAIEAWPPHLPRLEAEIARLGAAGKVEIVHAALGAQARTVTITGNPAIADGGAGLGAGGGRTVRADVPGTTLDRLFLEAPRGRIDWLKIDIEGADLDALEGGRGVLSAHRPVVAAAAYHTPEHLWQIADLLGTVLGPARLHAGHDPNWLHHLHFVAVPDSRAASR